ncbi:MAG: hypothetical protein F6J98_42415 [Moorea sp. SIO4G2]|nr:hypothetical protein [Moorena sp. SIO4G2]
MANRPRDRVQPENQTTRQPNHLGQKATGSRSTKQPSTKQPSTKQPSTNEKGVAPVVSNPKV